MEFAFDRFPRVPKTAIKLFSGGYLDLVDPDPNSIYTEDISIGLSRIGRYGSQTREFYSVAQHSVLVSRLACQVEGISIHAARWGLLHDATEAFLGDMVWPLKKNVPGIRETYERIESNMMSAIRDRFDLRWPEPRTNADTDIPASVRYADMVVLLSEVRDLFPGDHEFFSLVEDRVGLHGATLIDRIVPLSPNEAHEEFMQEAARLGIE